MPFNIFVESIQEGAPPQKVTVTHYYAPWAKECKQQDAIIDEVKKVVKDTVSFKRVNVEDGYDIPIKKVPSIAIKKNGKGMFLHEGLTSKNQILSVLKNLLS
jgi:thioredoxin-like negative regulator of GroEL